MTVLTWQQGANASESCNDSLILVSDGLLGRVAVQMPGSGLAREGFATMKGIWVVKTSARNQRKPIGAILPWAPLSNSLFAKVAALSNSSLVRPE